jgi:uncharacterized protein (DUF1697 family)
MTSYIALLRGIGPGNPNMRNVKLRAVFEKLGFQNVKSVISSGNILFESPETNSGELERQIEETLPLELGFSSVAIVRSREELLEIAAHDPFAGMSHTRLTNLNVTFLKEGVPDDFEPVAPPDKPFHIARALDREIFAVLDLTKPGAPKYMAWLEKQFGNKNTTRTWQTVQRILKAFTEDSRPGQ